MDAVFQKIDRYLNSKSALGTLVVDVQNPEDMEQLVNQYQMPGNVFLCASDPAFCNKDAFPSIDALYNHIQEGKQNFFVSELSTFFLLKGEKELTEMLMEVLGLKINGHVVLITWQCAPYLQNILAKDKRLHGRIIIHQGKSVPWPQLSFIAAEQEPDCEEVCIFGIDGIASAVEKNLAGQLFIKTSKKKDFYPHSLYIITQLDSAYRMLCQRDSATFALGEEAGTADQWCYAMEQFRKEASWNSVIWSKFGNTEQLANLFSAKIGDSTDSMERWLYFIGLKLFGAGDDTYLSEVLQNCDSINDLPRQVYRSILDMQPTDAIFGIAYDCRKRLLLNLDNPLDEVLDFCKVVGGKAADAIYYMTDNTQQEKEMIFTLLDKYGQDMDRQVLLDVLKVVYPDLWQYMSPFQFKNELLDSYFQDYKYQKVINKILPEFMSVVEQQAVEREYNMILPARSAVVDGLDTSNTQSYFTDAMGVEYLGYIMSRCREYHLMASVTLARCNLPSITVLNKDFWETLNTESNPIISVPDLDDIKHEGKNTYDYTKTREPIHLIEELEIIDRLLNKIHIDLAKQSYDKAILIADHGASRLAVISESDNQWEMKEKGKHSGRCCPKSDVDTPPEFALDADDYWVLANYDRFKGSRKANVEVHGGATLEEVVVPIIELTYISGPIEVNLLPLDGATFSGTPEVKFGYKKYPGLRIYISQKVRDVSITIDGVLYEAKPDGDNHYVVKEITHFKKAGTSSVDVFVCGNMIKSDLPLVVKTAGVTKKSFF